jgi:hypothetical protein
MGAAETWTEYSFEPHGMARCIFNVDSNVLQAAMLSADREGMV